MMKINFKKSHALLIFAIVLVLVIILGVVFFFMPPSPQKAELLLKKDIVLLEKVINYFEDTEIENAYIYWLTSDYDVGDEDVNKAIEKLFERGYRSISKRNGQIEFLKWTRFKDFGAGIVFSTNGKKPTFDYLIKIEPLSMENWYYYEEN